jgi:hypothetical protein
MSSYDSDAQLAFALNVDFVAQRLNPALLGRVPSM